MNKKIYLQILLIFTVLFILVSTYYIYFYKKKSLKNFEEENKVSKLIEKSNISNVMEELKYSSTDNNGNMFEINSQTGQIDINNPDLILMQNVKAKIFLVNSLPIYVAADYAKYNNNTYETNFSKNVLINHAIHQINSENFDLSFENNLASIYKDVIYQSLDTKIITDRIEIDLISKNSKIFMNDKSKNLKIISKK